MASTDESSDGWCQPHYKFRKANPRARGTSAPTFFRPALSLRSTSGSATSRRENDGAAPTRSTIHHLRITRRLISNAA